MPCPAAICWLRPPSGSTATLVAHSQARRLTACWLAVQVPPQAGWVLDGAECMGLGMSAAGDMLPGVYADRVHTQRDNVLHRFLWQSSAVHGQSQTRRRMSGKQTCLCTYCETELLCSSMLAARWGHHACRPLLPRQAWGSSAALACWVLLRAGPWRHLQIIRSRCSKTTPRTRDGEYVVLQQQSVRQCLSKDALTLAQVEGLEQRGIHHMPLTVSSWLPETVLLPIKSWLTAGQSVHACGLLIAARTW